MLAKFACTCDLFRVDRLAAYDVARHRGKNSTPGSRSDLTPAPSL
jgi:hypothetical protein